MFNASASWYDSAEQTLTPTREPAGISPKTEFSVCSCLIKIFRGVNPEASAETRVVIKREKAGLRPLLGRRGFPHSSPGITLRQTGGGARTTSRSLHTRTAHQLGEPPRQTTDVEGRPPQPGEDLDVGTVQLQRRTRAVWRSLEKGACGVFGDRVRKRSSFRGSSKNENRSVLPRAFHSKGIFAIPSLSPAAC